MKTNLKLALAVLAGVSIGAAGGRTIHGQQLKTPPAYIISEADAITDLAAIKQYGDMERRYRERWHLSMAITTLW
jgi:hypothetical protein